MPELAIKGNAKNILDSILATEKELDQVNAQAINATATKYQRLSIKATANAVKVQQKVIRGRSKFKGRQRANRRKQKAEVVALTLDIPAIRLGKPTRKGSGLNVGTGKARRFIDGGFVAPVDKGGKLVYKRTGKARYPIEHQTIVIDDEMVSHYRGILNRETPAIFQQEWRKRMNKVIRRAARG